MRAAIYARYSSENQRPESIEDQINSCRALALSRGYIVDDSRVFSDEAASGARSDRMGLAGLMEAAKNKAFEVILVDDLSRLARDNLLMLSIIAELDFYGIKVVSVADGLDTADTEAKVDCLKGEIAVLQKSKEDVFQPPPRQWIEEKVKNLQQLLEQRTPASAGLLRDLLGKIRLEPVIPDIGKPYLRATGKGQVLAVLSKYPFVSDRVKQANPLKKESADKKPGDKGSNSWRWWR